MIFKNVFRNASENIGQVTSCNELQLIEWAKKAKMAFGEVSTWDDATVQLVGSVIGNAILIFLSSKANLQILANLDK